MIDEACCGEWLKGSGGHIVWAYDCNEKPVFVDRDTGERWCFKHVPRLQNGDVHPTFADGLMIVGTLDHEMHKLGRAVSDVVDELPFPLRKVVMFLAKALGRFNR